MTITIGNFDTTRACYDRALAATSPQKSLQLLLDYAKFEGYTSTQLKPNEARKNAVKLFEMAVKRFPTQERLVKVRIDNTKIFM